MGVHIVSFALLGFLLVQVASAKRAPDPEFEKLYQLALQEKKRVDDNAFGKARAQYAKTSEEIADALTDAEIELINNKKDISLEYHEKADNLYMKAGGTVKGIVGAVKDVSKETAEATGKNLVTLNKISGNVIKTITEVTDQNTRSISDVLGSVTDATAGAIYSGGQTIKKGLERGTKLAGGALDLSKKALEGLQQAGDSAVENTLGVLQNTANETLMNWKKPVTTAPF